jgi:hypothetical protein
MKEAQSDTIVRPVAGTYPLALRSIAIAEGTYKWQKPSAGAVPALNVVLQWRLEEDPASGESVDFPGNFWHIPLVDAATFAKLPDGQKQHLTIGESQLKGVVTALLGNDPGESFLDELQGFASVVDEATKAEEPYRFTTTLKYQKKDPSRFEREVVGTRIA